MSFLTRRKRFFVLVLLCLAIYIWSFKGIPLRDLTDTEQCISQPKPPTITQYVTITKEVPTVTPTNGPVVATSEIQSESAEPKRPLPPTGAHLFRDDGLVEVNPDGPHPIFELLKRAEKDWKAKIKRASKSLDDAVEEYQRRYNRMPPAGFDDW